MRLAVEEAVEDVAEKAAEETAEEAAKEAAKEARQRKQLPWTRQKRNVQCNPKLTLWLVVKVL